MKGTVRGGTVPLTISYRKVTERPEVERTRRFVGWKRVWANIAIKVIEAIEEVAYEQKDEVLKAGKQSVVHWAIEIENPWDMNDVSTVRAIRVPDKPAAGLSLEVIKIIDPEEPVHFNGAAPVGTPARRSPDQEAIRRRFREQLKEDGHYDPETGPAQVDDAFDGADNAA